jgi:cell wall-associated NlpC family hydrolase
MARKEGLFPIFAPNFIPVSNRSFLKNLFLIFSLAALATSCSSTRRAAGNSSQAAVSGNRRSSSPEFIENISIKPEHKKEKIRTAASVPSGPSNVSLEGVAPGTDYSLQFKYAILLDVPVEDVTDNKLIEYIESWYGTPYRYGGSDRTGVDCSSFVQSFLSFMYGFSVPRTSREQYSQSKRISKKELEEGDLVFFKTSGRTISHVGVYLRNNRFVHAATSGGVMISDLDEDYYSRRYAGAGRVK